MTITKDQQDDMAAVLVGLSYLDVEIRRAQGGEPGSGIYSLLDMLAGQFLGIPRGSYPVAPITPAAPPVNVDIPFVQPQEGATIGTTLTCTMGNWDGEPTGYEYQWQAIGDDPPLALGTGPSYLVQDGDAGSTIACLVTASNAAGATDAPLSNSVLIEGPAAA